MRYVLAANRRNLLALGAVTLLLVGTYLLVPHPVAQYGAWLVIFTIWMVWFVHVGFEWLSNADF